MYILKVMLLAAFAIVSGACWMIAVFSSSVAIYNGTANFWDYAVMVSFAIVSLFIEPVVWVAKQLPSTHDFKKPSKTTDDESK